MKKNLAIVFSVFMISFFFACDKEVEYAVNNKTVILFVKDSVALSLSPVNAGWVFTSENSDIASVSPSGIVKGVHMGTIKITVRDTLSGFSEQVKVTVNSRNSLYREPCPTFNVDEYTVRKYETRELLSTSQEGDGSYYLRYKADNTYHNNVIYFFDENQKYYLSEVVIFDFFKDRLDAYLNDKCFALPNPNSNRFVPYVTPDGSMRIYADNTLERTMVLYTAGDYEGYLRWVFWKDY